MTGRRFANLTAMVQLNKTQVDLLEKFQQLIEEYDKGMDVATIFAKRDSFADESSEEDKRGVAGFSPG